MKTYTIIREIVLTFVVALLATFIVMIVARLMQMPGAKILTDGANAFVMHMTSIALSQLAYFWWMIPILLLILGLLYRRSTERETKRASRRFTPAIYHDIRYEEYYDVDKVKVIKKRVRNR